MLPLQGRNKFNNSIYTYTYWKKKKSKWLPLFLLWLVITLSNSSFSSQKKIHNFLIYYIETSKKREEQCQGNYKALTMAGGHGELVMLLNNLWRDCARCRLQGWDEILQLYLTSYNLWTWIWITIKHPVWHTTKRNLYFE